MRGVLGEDELRRLDHAVERHMPRHAYAPGKVYPEPAKYTLAGQIVADPDFAFVSEHPGIVGPAEDLLGGASHLTAFVVYERTAGNQGSAPHFDYKCWRPVGSSMDWLFTIVPLTDFDPEHGPLLVAPGSHRPGPAGEAIRTGDVGMERGVENAKRGAARVLEREAGAVPAETDFIDPALRRGDLLLMNMYLWHSAPPNARRRIGLFNKYAAADAPPASGYFLWNGDVHSHFSPEGRRLLAVHDDRPLAMTRGLLVAGGALLLEHDGDGRWSLPGARGVEEQAIPGWDHGNRIGALDFALRERLGLTVPWMSYLGDYEEADPENPGASLLCRVYIHPMESRPEPRPTGPETGWFTPADLARLGPDALAQPYIGPALDRWFESPARRGKGISQARALAGQ